MTSTKTKPRIRTAIATVLASSLTITAAGARIGETPQECAVRYGPPAKTIQEGLLLYQKSGFNVIVAFFNGEADGIVYMKTSKNALGKGEEISDNEIELLLKSNAAESPWEEISLIAMHRGWATKDRKLIAKYNPLENMLLVATEGYFDREEERKSRMENENLEGF